MEFAESISCKGCNVAFTPKRTRRAIKYCTRECLDQSADRLRLYGVNKGDVDFMLATQGGGCAICGTKDGKWRVDHCHDTGKIRGVLCDPCNTGLGLFRGDTEALQRAVGYVTHAEFVRP